MVSAVTGTPSGQKAKIHTGRRKRIEMTFRKSPNFPKDHLRGGSSSPLRRLAMTHPMVMMYEVRIETHPHELMALSAVDEPRLMQAIMEVTKMERPTDCSGMFQPGVT